MVEDLCLDFILPGHQNLELMKGGKNKPVLGENLEQYIDLVAHWSMVEGVRRQFSALKCGFNELFDIKKLSLFLPWELPRTSRASPQPLPRVRLEPKSPLLAPSSLLLSSRSTLCFRLVVVRRG